MGHWPLGALWPDLNNRVFPREHLCPLLDAGLWQSATKKEALGNQRKACRLLPLHQVLRGTLPMSVVQESAMQVGPSSHLDRGVSSSDLQLEPDTLTCPQLLLRGGTGRGIQGSRIPSGLGSALSYPPSLLQEGPET